LLVARLAAGHRGVEAGRGHAGPFRRHVRAPLRAPIADRDVALDAIGGAAIGRPAVHCASVVGDGIERTKIVRAREKRNTPYEGEDEPLH
jgi:hypothetical protein